MSVPDRKTRPTATSSAPRNQAAETTRDQAIGQRIAEARAATGIGQAQLAAALGVGPTVMSKIESGKRRLDGFELAVLAEALGTTSRALLGMATRTSALMAAARIGAGTINPALGRARDLLELDGVADELGLAGRATPRRLQPPKRRSTTAANELARTVLHECGSVNTGISDLIRVVERDFGVDVAVEPLGDGFDGVLVQHHDEVALVVLNSDNHVSRQRFTLAHEFGHWLLGDAEPVVVDADVGGDTEVERRANRFAIELLMPEDGVRHVVDSAPDLVCAVVDGLVQFGVSREALVNRLTSLRLATKRQADEVGHDTVRSLFARAGRQSDYNAWAADGPARRIPSRIEKRLITAYTEGRIGIGMLAQAFNERPTDLAARLADSGIVVNITLDTSAVADI